MHSIVSNIKISRFVVISGILTFLYLIELCVGARTVYYVFYLWNNPTDGKPLDAKVSWTLCVACLLTAAASSFVVNFMSALWEQKQIKEDGKEKSVLRFTLHLFAGGMLWRYIAMWFSDNEEHLKRQALLLTMAKFLFTHFFTIPLVIVHASLLDNLEELIYDVCSVLCISFNLLLTCTVFSWGKKLIIDLKKWNYETIDLVPLIFSQSFLNEETPKEKNPDNNTLKKHEKSQEQINEVKETAEQSLVRLVVLLQTFCFSFGRLLALGILLKLAGIYAVSIMFLQLLTSVIYLKFQVPILVSDTLQKWRQLTRLAFMSYILIFEWHLNRDSNTGCDFDSNIKHSVIYYSVATIESVFYLITWAVTTSISADDAFDEFKRDQTKFAKIIIVIGTLTLVFSLVMHLILIMWRSRRISTLVYSVRRKYACFKMSIKKHKEVEKGDSTQKKQIEISHPIPINNLNEVSCNEEEDSELNKHNSYKDLREPLDDEIEIYSRENEVNVISTLDRKVDSPAKVFVKMQQKSSSKGQTVSPLKMTSNKNECDLDNSTQNKDDTKNDTPTTRRAKKHSSKATKQSKEIQRDVADEAASNGNHSKKSEAVNTIKVSLKNEIPNEKSKVVVISETFSDQWNKISMVSQKFSGTIRDQFQKRKTQLQMFRNNSTEKPNTVEKKVSKKRKLNVTSSAEPPKQFIGEVYSTEGYFVGDDQDQNQVVSYPNEETKNVNTVKKDVIVSNEEEKLSAVEVESSEENVDEELDPPHCVDGDKPCTCFICKTGNMALSRRRSSSVPPPERRKIVKLESLLDAKEILRYPSNPTLSKNVISATSGIDAVENNCNKTSQFSPNARTIKRIHNLSLMSLDRVEHYV